ncbi:HSPB1-associated protein 1-like [Tubulanus polymorphus]|uniref:HSPB1-associated protein 1-like n=1 Tax=Tubulanus polymorphus TaxID=672921 RepID=UPI003DA45EF0
MEAGPMGANTVAQTRRIMSNISTLAEVKNLTSPHIISGAISKWPASEWTPELIAAKLNGKKIQFRIGKRSHSQDVQWEANCHYVMARMNDFIEWDDDDRILSETNPLSPYGKAEYWAYADYKYFTELFDELPEIQKDVNWETFGFEGRDGKSSTFWLGSRGAYTPCHQDTYGCNFVAQIYGRKRWILFPPEQTCFMYPTRLPFEESSIFSRVNVKQPHKKFRNFRKTTPSVVTLEPGQVLFVPRHWWHHVESLETSISVNSWIELPEDDESRLHEALSRLIITSLMETDSTIELDDWLNPTEDVQPYKVNLRYVNSAACAYRNSRVHQTPANNNCGRLKKQKTSDSPHSSPTNWTVNTAKSMPFEQYLQTFVEMDSLAHVESDLANTDADDADSRTVSTAAIVRALTNPRIIRQISDLIINEFESPVLVE